jgi:hypothetical protein
MLHNSAVTHVADTTTGDVLGGASLPTVKIMDNPERPGERHIVELSETGIIYQKLDVIFELVSSGLSYRYTQKSLLDLIVELQCGLKIGRGHEEATRLLVVFLRSTSMRRLLHPVLPELVGSLPLNALLMVQYSDTPFPPAFVTFALANQRKVLMQ